MEKIITFTVSGNEITGKLQGNAHLWTFESEAEYFKTNFETGKMMKHTFVKPTCAGNQRDIYSIVCGEAELPGL